MEDEKMYWLFRWTVALRRARCVQLLDCIKYHSFTNFLKVNNNKLPNTAGITRLISQIAAVVSPTPSWFVVNIAIAIVIVVPRKGSSIRAIVGITAIIKKDTLTPQSTSENWSSTANTGKISRY